MKLVVLGVILMVLGFLGTIIATYAGLVSWFLNSMGVVILGFALFLWGLCRNLLPPAAPRFITPAFFPRDEDSD